MLLSLQGERESELKALQREFQQVDQNCKTNTAAQQEKLVLLGKLQSEEEQYKKRVKERDLLLSQLAHRHQWPGHSPYPSDQPLSNKTIN